MTDQSVGPELAKASLVLARDVMQIKAGEDVVITCDSRTDQKAIAAVVNASASLDARVVTLQLNPPLPFQGGLADPYISEPVAHATNHCDAWIDLCMPYMAGAGVYHTAMKNNRTRYFLAADIGSEGITRVFGRSDIEKVFAVSDLFSTILAESAGKRCRFSTPLGTDVEFVLADPEGLTIEKASKPGGFFVPGTVMVIPELETVKGTIVCESTFHEYYTKLDTPYRFVVDGKIKEVTGGGTELPAIKRSLKRAGNGEYGNIVHFTCGYHPAARMTGTSFIEDQRAVGCNAVGLGLPQWVEGGGENHPDCVMSEQSFWIGEEQIIDSGSIVGPPSLAQVASELELLYE